ncbi:16S rRNA (guanine(527)-N(7))-methyltransferase RsmG [Salinithrix halophila]|uniref:Ribosomal RNA small subunit methyltransferase G n=1 Tax=Salinithrix halophila TaxID=1485204 RepID=A0ABV8JFU5_9BACL
MDYREWLQERAAEDLGVELSGAQLDQFHRYYRRLVEINQQMNLTAITEEKEVFAKHFYDSLTLAHYLPFHELKSLIDVGTGAGFPGLALKIAFPDIRLALLDSLNKRVVFLRELAEELDLAGVETIHGRAEETARLSEYRERFDLATARAVAKLNVLAEYCLPFVRVGGCFAAMKGPGLREEMKEGKRAVEKLGGQEIEERSLSLPEGMGERHLILIEKKVSTPKAYPRKPGTPLRKPI